MTNRQFPPINRQANQNRPANQDLNGKVSRELNFVTANRFYVEIESQIAACFTECQGLGVKVKYERYQEGGVNEQQRIILGQAEFSDITLKRGVTNDFVFLEWLSEIFTQLIDRPQRLNSQQREIRSNNIFNDRQQQSKTITRRNINILLFNQAGETMQCWTLIGAIPVGWKAPSLQASSNNVAIEELTLAYEGLKVINASLQEQTNARGGGATLLTTGRDSRGYFDSK